MLKIYSLLIWLTLWAICITGGIVIHLFFNDATPLMLIVLMGCAVAISAAAHLTRKSRYDDE